MKQKGFAPILLMLVIAIIAVGGTYYIGQLNNHSLNPIELQSSSSPTFQVQHSPSPEPTNVVKSNAALEKWKIFSSNEYKVTFRYPDNESFEGIPNEPGTVFIFGEVDTIHFTATPKVSGDLPSSFNNKVSTSTRVIEDLTWYEFSLPNGYNEHITSPTYILRIEKNNLIYTAEFRNRLKLNSEDEIFINSVKFN